MTQSRKNKFYRLQNYEWVKLCNLLTHSELKVLFHLRTLEPWGTRYQESDTEEFGQVLGISQRSVQRALKRLSELELISLEIASAMKVKSQPKTDLSDESYEEFLESDYWIQVRKRVLARDGFRCQSCDSKKTLHVHHLTYKNHGQEHEHLEDLVTLCARCHEQAHPEKTKLTGDTVSL